MNTMTAQALNIQVNAIWTQDGVIPPRCRTPRTVRHDIETTVTVRCITSEELPVAIRVQDVRKGIKDLHYYEGAYYAPYDHYSTKGESVVAGSAQFPFTVDERSEYGDTYDGANLDEALAAIQTSYDKYLIVDGIVWEKNGSEPYYEVHRGGGTFRDERGYTYIWATTRSSGGEWAMFNALEWDEALEYALSITPEDEREETRAKLEASRPIEVLRPEVIHANFNRVKAKGLDTISEYLYKAKDDIKKGLDASESVVDPEAVGRGEITYRQFLEAALKNILDVEEPRMRAEEAERRRNYGW